MNLLSIYLTLVPWNSPKRWPHQNNINSYLSLHYFLACSNPLNLLSPLFQMYSSTILSLEVIHLQPLSLLNIIHSMRYNYFIVLDLILSITSLHSFTSTRHNKFVIHTYINFSFHSSFSTGFFQLINLYYWQITV